MEAHSTLPEKPDSTKPGTKAESFALLESEVSLQRFVEEWKPEDCRKPSGRMPRMWQWRRTLLLIMPQRRRSRS